MKNCLTKNNQNKVKIFEVATRKKNHSPSAVIINTLTLLCQQIFNSCCVHICMRLLVPVLFNSAHLSLPGKSLANHINANHGNHREKAEWTEGGHLK